MCDLADARRRAEEALAALDEAYGARVVARSVDCICALRSLLAALPAEGEAEAREYGPCPAYRDGEPHAGCDLCGGFGALPILSEADLAPAPQPAPTTDASILPVCLDCSFASGGHVHVNREDGSQAVRYPTPEEWNAALRSRPLPPGVEAAAETHRVEVDHRCCLDLLRSARLYFADGHPMRLAIERTLAERPVPPSARAAKGGAS